MQEVNHMDDGRVAFWAGRSLDACPYPAGTDNSIQWKMGWLSAREERNHGGSK